MKVAHERFRLMDALLVCALMARFERAFEMLRRLAMARMMCDCKRTVSPCVV